MNTSYACVWEVYRPTVHDEKKMWDEDVRMYRSHGFSPTLTKLQKMAWKVPQFISAKLKF